MISMTSLIKQRIIYLIQFVTGMALVTWILMQIDRDQFMAYFANLSFFPLVGVGVLSIAGLVVQFQRWKYLVEQYSLSFSVKDLIPSFFAGFTFRLMIPGGHAEFSKIFLLPGKKRGKALAYGMEKIFQTLIKIVALLIVFPLSFPGYTIHALLIGVLIMIGYFYFPRIPILKGFQEKDVRYHQVFGMNVLYSIGVFVTMGVQYYLLLNQTNVISLSETLHVVVYLWAAGMVPVSISGLGVREGLAVYFLSAYGISGAHAVATSLFLFTMNTIGPALVGAYYIFKNRHNFGEIRNSIKSTREIIQSFRNQKREE